jgi:hypothetical protein
MHLMILRVWLCSFRGSIASYHSFDVRKASNWQLMQFSRLHLHGVTWKEDVGGIGIVTMTVTGRQYAGKHFNLLIEVMIILQDKISLRISSSEVQLDSLMTSSLEE